MYLLQFIVDSPHTCTSNVLYLIQYIRCVHMALFLGGYVLPPAYVLADIHNQLYTNVRYLYGLLLNHIRKPLLGDIGNLEHVPC